MLLTVVSVWGVKRVASRSKFYSEVAAANPYKQILSEIRAKRFAPVYILSGEEPYYIDLIADALQEYVVAEEERDFNLHLYYGQDADMETMINTAWQYPVMADRKLVMLREAQAMPSARTQLDKLEVYLKSHRPLPSWLFISTERRFATLPSW